MAKILVIDDEPDNGSVLTELLDSYGFETVLAQTIPEGAQRLASEPFSAVLADYVTGEVRDAEREANWLLDVAGTVPVVCVSAWRFLPPKLLQRFASVLNKPYGVAELLSIVGTITSMEVRPVERAAVLRYFAALTDRDWDGLAALCTDDVQYHAPEVPLISGREDFKRFSTLTFANFPDARFEVLEVDALPNGAMAKFKSQWRQSEHETVQFEGAVAFGFAAGKIARIDVRIDRGRLTHLVGETSVH